MHHRVVFRTLGPRPIEGLWLTAGYHFHLPEQPFQQAKRNFRREEQRKTKCERPTRPALTQGFYCSLLQALALALSTSPPC